jgi:hypothetical protein
MPGKAVAMSTLLLASSLALMRPSAQNTARPAKPSNSRLSSLFNAVFPPPSRQYGCHREMDCGAGAPLRRPPVQGSAGAAMVACHILHVSHTQSAR